MTMKNLLLLAVCLGTLLAAIGCSPTKAAEPGYSKADFAKTPPPANWPHGPNGTGAPGAPPPPPPGAGTPGGPTGAPAADGK